MEDAGFEIDGERYEIPKLNTITLDEERILYLYADSVLQDFATPHPEMPKKERQAYELLQMRKVRDPAFKRALAHIAYRRKHPKMTDQKIHQAIGLVNALEVDIALVRGDAEDPPAKNSQKQPEKQSASSEGLKSTDSGRTIVIDSDPADENPEPTGTSESDISSPGVTRLASVS